MPADDSTPEFPGASADQQAAVRSSEMVLTRAWAQRLEAWMVEVTDLLCYQLDVPLAHKTEIVNALKAFQKEVDQAHRPQSTRSGDTG